MASKVPKHYRIYVLGSDGHIHSPPLEINLPDDGDAVALARSRLDRHVLEVWSGERLVARLTPPGRGKR